MAAPSQVHGMASPAHLSRGQCMLTFFRVPSRGRVPHTSRKKSKLRGIVYLSATVVRKASREHEVFVFFSGERGIAKHLREKKNLAQHIRVVEHDHDEDIRASRRKNTEIAKATHYRRDHQERWRQPRCCGCPCCRGEQ